KQIPGSPALPGTRCSRLETAWNTRGILPNTPPRVELKASAENLTLACKNGETSTNCAGDAEQTVKLKATSSDPDGDNVLYTYSVTGGKVRGNAGSVFTAEANDEALWDLGGVGPGTYTVSLEVDDGCGCIASTSATISREN